MLPRLAALLVPLLAFPLWAAEPAVHRDLAYTEPHHPRQAVDIYTPPAGGKPKPIVFWIHGGGWQAGDKNDVDVKPPAFTERGYVFVSVGYRLLGDQVTIGQMAADCAKAIRWVCDHAAEYGGDPKRLVITGHSAGAQLAALLCTDSRYVEVEGIPLSRVKGCIPVDGDTYDVPLQISTVNERTAGVYRRKFGDPQQQVNLSPITHVARGKHIPPVLILHVADHPETKLQSETLVKALKTAGVPARAYGAQNKVHVTINSDLGKPEDRPTEVMFDFIARVLRER